MFLFGWFVSVAWAQEGGGAGAPQLNPLVSLAPFILIFVFFYFLMIRPQQKKAKDRKAMVDALKKGDRISTNGGLVGTVTNLGDKIITLQIAEGVRVKVIRNNIEVMEKEGSKKLEKKGSNK